jgi:hypothetical protein
MSYSKLNIDRKNISALLNGFCDISIHNPILSSKFVRNGQEQQFTVNGHHDGEKKEIKISFISNLNGSTSINYKIGKFHDIGKQMADFVRENGVTDNRKNSITSIHSVAKGDFDFVLENLKIDYQYLTVGEKEIPYGIQKKINISTGEQIIFNYYESNTLTISGIPLLLHNSALNYFTELNYLKPIERIDSTVKYYQIKTTFSDFERELKDRLPIAYEHIPSNVKAFLLSSIILEKIDIDLPDYSCFAFNILKAIEGIMKHLLFEKGIVINRAFDIFKNNIEPVRIKESTNKTISCPKTTLVIENFYEYYKKERHSLFHSEYIDVTTRLVEKREDVIDILNNSLNLINDSYDNLINS